MVIKKIFLKKRSGHLFECFRKKERSFKSEGKLGIHGWRRGFILLLFLWVFPFLLSPLSPPQRSLRKRAYKHHILVINLPPHVVTTGPSRQTGRSWPADTPEVFRSLLTQGGNDLRKQRLITPDCQQGSKRTVCKQLRSLWVSSTFKEPVNTKPQEK